VPIFPVGVPQPLAIRGPFAAVTVDAARRRVFAAGARSVVMLDADTGKLLATVRLGGASSVAIEPLGGHLFVGTHAGKISEIDPDRKTIVRSLDAGGAVDVLLYDSNTGRLYADGGGRTALATFDARTFTALAPVPLPGGVPAGLVPDPITRELYVDFADRPEIAVVDPQRGAVHIGFPTPGLPGKRVVRFDDALGQIVVVSGNGIMDVYDRAGTRRARITLPAGIGACDLDTGNHIVACTDPDGLTFVQLQREAAPHVIATAALGGIGPVAFDTKTDDAVVVCSNPDGSGAGVWHFSALPPKPSPSPSAR
jgi:DNA-binding beta-propeller fold protein YncE